MIIFHFLFKLAYMWTKVKVRTYTCLWSRDSKIFLWRMATFYNPASRVMWLYSISYSDWHTMCTKVKVKMSSCLRRRNSKEFLWRMVTFYNPASGVMWLHSISCSVWHTCELKLRLKCLLALGVGTVKSFFGEWPLFIILHSISCLDWLTLPC